jgi:hypothetical protein
MTDDALGCYPPAKAAAAEERRRRIKLMQELLSLPTRELFIGALRLQGIAEGSAEWQAALAAWSDFQRQRD